MLTCEGLSERENVWEIALCASNVACWAKAQLKKILFIEKHKIFFLEIKHKISYILARITYSVHAQEKYCAHAQ